MKNINASLGSAAEIISLRERAILAFRQGEDLNFTDLDQYTAVFGVATFAEAWTYTKAYAFGDLVPVGSDLNLIIASWLAFGETEFRLFYNVALEAKVALQAGYDAFDSFVCKLRSILPQAQMRRIRRQLREIWDSLFESVALAA